MNLSNSDLNLQLRNTQTSSKQFTSIDLSHYATGNDGYNRFNFSLANGSFGAEAATNVNDTLGIIDFQGWESGLAVLDSFEPVARIIGLTGPNFSPGGFSADREGQLVFATNNGSSNSPLERMRIDENGNVGIGTATPLANLHVQGDFRLQTGTAVANIVDSLTLDGFTTADNIADTMLLTGSAIKTLISDSLTTTGDNLGDHVIRQHMVHDPAYTFGPIIDIGDNAELHDVNLANTVTIVGSQNSAIAQLKLGTSTALPMARGDLAAPLVDRVRTGQALMLDMARPGPSHAARLVAEALIASTDMPRPG